MLVVSVPRGHRKQIDWRVNMLNEQILTECLGAFRMVLEAVAKNRNEPVAHS